MLAIKKICLSVLFCAVLLLSSCSSTKYVPNDAYLLDRVTIKADNSIIKQEELRGYLRQTPNASVLGLWRMNLSIYSLSGRESSKWINRFLRKLGDEPVIYNPSLMAMSRMQLQLAMQNRGFINAEVTDSVVLSNKKAKVIYTVAANAPYRVHNYSSNFTDSLLTAIAGDTTRSYIKPNMLFDVDVLEKERERVAGRFRQNGYYYFRKDALSYIADSTLNVNKIDLTLGLKESLNDLPEKDKKTVFQQCRVRNVIFQVNKNLAFETDSLAPIALPDTLRKDGYILISPKEGFIRLSTLIQNTSVVPGRLYSDFGVERTYTSLNAIPAIRYINLNFIPVSDSVLDCKIYLIPAKEVKFSVETEATYTEGYWGVAGNINTQHKNLFHGAELLSLQARLALEKQGEVLAQEYGGQIGLQFPNFLMPFISTELKRRIRATTEFTVNDNYQFRPQEYTMNNFGGALKYHWNWQQSRSTLELIDLSYVYFPDISEYFNNRYLVSGTYNRYNYQDHLIMRLAYSNTYSGFTASRPLRNFVSYAYNVETAGNVLYGLTHLMNAKRNEDGSHNFFNIRYAQYIKGFFSMSYNQIFDQNNRIVYRAALGVGVPYGNANNIPYERRFFGGGASGVRGWSENMLGPGVYSRSANSGRRDFNQSGDIKIDLNMEVRSKLFWLLEGALFVDAGNIWTIKDYPEQAGGLFKFNEFYKQMAISYGFGIRADFSFFLLRVDLGTKLYNPALDRRNAWRTSPNPRD
ncbi:MAG: BamA/TamA family outer membrane protein, partial [Prevotellaceae bacterium]|nr:BamA/TamA family outer membrane protein [Prevotellaceae bacterium]